MRNLVILADDVRVVRHSELARLYEIAGGVRPLAEALGVSPTTVWRALGGTHRTANGNHAARVEAVRNALDAR